MVPFESSKEQSKGLAHGIHTAVNTHTVTFLQTSTVYLQNSHHRSDVPHVDKCDVRKLTAPFCCNTDAVNCRQDDVTQALPAIEAGVGRFPNAVQTFDSIRFCEDVLERYLQHEINKYNLRT